MAATRTSHCNGETAVCRSEVSFQNSFSFSFISESVILFSENEIPDATKYFLDTTGKGYAFLDEERKPVSLEESIKALKAKFNVL